MSKQIPTDLSKSKILLIFHELHFKQHISIKRPLSKMIHHPFTIYRIREVNQLSSPTENLQTKREASLCFFLLNEIEGTVHNM